MESIFFKNRDVSKFDPGLYLEWTNFDMDLKKSNRIVVGFDLEFSVDLNRTISAQFSWFSDNCDFCERFIDFECEHDYAEKYLENGRIKSWKSFLEMLYIVIGNVSLNSEYTQIYIMSQYGTAELSNINNFKSDLIDIGAREINFGKYSTFDFKDPTGRVRKIHWFDTMNYGKMKLDKIGKQIGYKKINFEYEIRKLIPDTDPDLKCITMFNDYLHNPITRDLCITYGLRDSSICLIYTLMLGHMVSTVTRKAEIFRTLPSISERLILETNPFYYEQSGYEYVPVKGSKDKVIPVLNESIRIEGVGTYYGGRNQAFVVGFIKQLVRDFDLNGSYSNTLKAIPAIKPLHHGEKPITMSYSEAINYINQFPDEEKVRLQGSYKGDIYYKKSIRSTPTLQGWSNGLVELKHDNVSHTLVEFVYIFIFHPEYIDFERTKLKSINVTVFPVDLKTRPLLAFSELVNNNRSLFLSVHPYNKLWKSVGNLGYGKITQGIETSRRKGALGKETRTPESTIFQPLYSSYITALPRLLTHASYMHLMNLGLAVPLTNITDGFCALIIKDFPTEELENDPFVKACKQAMLMGDKPLYVMKHEMPDGYIVPKVRVDFVPEYKEGMTEEKTKIALPSAYSKPEDFKQMVEDVNYFLSNPDELIPAYKLKGIKDLKDDQEAEVLSTDLVNKHFDWNIPGNKKITSIGRIELNKHKPTYVNIIDQNLILLEPFEEMKEMLENYEIVHSKKYRNKLIYYQTDNLKQFKTKQKVTKEKNVTNNMTEKFVNNLIVAGKSVGRNITYKDVESFIFGFDDAIKPKRFEYLKKTATKNIKIAQREVLKGMTTQYFLQQKNRYRLDQAIAITKALGIKIKTILEKEWEK